MFQLLIVAIFVISASGEDPPAPTSTTLPPPQTCDGQNEFYLAAGVAPNCDTVCSEIGKPCTRVYVKAPSGCYCLPNHARNDSNVCVPINECQIWCASWKSSSEDGSFSLRVKGGTSGAQWPGRPLPTLPLPHPRLPLPSLPAPSLPSSSLPSPSLSSPSLSSPSLSSPSMPKPLPPWRPRPRIPLPLPRPPSSPPSPSRPLSYPPSLSSVSSISSMSSISSFSSVPSQPPQSKFLQPRPLPPRGVCSYQYFLSSNGPFSPVY